ncbi:phospholipase D-like domain-containing protein, partial [Citrobacter freundii]|nr:phospholipase D-like domain-containing protein [Citrobacter freundii]
MKNLATWLLAAAFTTAALPAFAVEPSVQVGYSPEGSARVLVLSAIDSAKTSIRMMAYSFTAPDIMKALVAAKKRGVDVKIGHCCKVSDEAAFCLIQRPYISKTLLT